MWGTRPPDIEIKSIGTSWHDFEKRWPVTTDLRAWILEETHKLWKLLHTQKNALN